MAEPLFMFATWDNTAGVLSTQLGNNLMPLLLMLLIGIVLGGLIGGLLALHLWRRDRLTTRRPARRPEYSLRERKSSSPLVPAPTRWLAVRTGNPYLVQVALGLHKPTLCSWEEGLYAVAEQKLFISPPVRGWILVLGSRLPDPADDVDRAFRFILALSRKLGQVQFFSLNRAVNHHAWIKADHGGIVRAYAWAGRTLWHQGDITPAEIELGMKCYPYAEARERVGFAQVDPAVLNTDRLSLLAARWSVDPATIDAHMLKESQGISGELSRSRTY